MSGASLYSQRLQVYAVCLALSLGGCAHTKPIGQSMVALGALLVGLGTLDAAGVLGSECSHGRTPDGESLSSCSGNGVTPHADAVNILGIAFGAALGHVSALVLLSRKGTRAGERHYGRHQECVCFHSHPHLPPQPHF